MTNFTGSLRKSDGTFVCRVILAWAGRQTARLAQSTHRNCAGRCLGEHFAAVRCSCDRHGLSRGTGDISEDRCIPAAASAAYRAHITTRWSWTDEELQLIEETLRAGRARLVPEIDGEAVAGKPDKP